LTISSNSTGGNISVGLSGTGDPHQVQLSWTPPAPTSDPVAGYNIYRAVGGSPNYQQIAQVYQSTYSDSTVVHASAYVYYVKSFDASGVESTASNSTSVTIP
jgi:fibronectin type 3 domain-containing protein